MPVDFLVHLDFYPALTHSVQARGARALRALGLLLADGVPTLGSGKNFWCETGDTGTRTASIINVGNFLVTLRVPTSFGNLFQEKTDLTPFWPKNGQLIGSIDLGARVVSCKTPIYFIHLRGCVICCFSKMVAIEEQADELDH